MGRRNRAAASGGASLRPFYLVLALVAVVGLAGLAYAVLGSRAGGAVLEPIVLEGIEDPRALVAKAEGVMLGDAAAPAKLLVFSDYQCPYCGQFASQITPQLKAEYVETGKLQYVYYDFPLGAAAGHPHAFVAARAARCAGEQGRFWEYHDVLFGQQSRWSFSSGPPLNEFEGYAAQLGLDGGAFESCLRSDRFADVVTANRLLGDQLQVDGTPTLILNGRRVQNWSRYGDLRRLIDEATGGEAGS